MNRWVLAALIWVGIDVLIGLIAAPVVVSVFVPGMIRAWARQDFVYMVDILTPNVLLMIVPGGIAAGGYLLIGSRFQRN